MWNAIDAMKPVLARPPSAAYQAIKFTHRHRTAVAAAALVVVALLTVLRWPLPDTAVRRRLAAPPSAPAKKPSQ